MGPLPFCNCQHSTVFAHLLDLKKLDTLRQNSRYSIVIFRLVSKRFANPSNVLVDEFFFYLFLFLYRICWVISVYLKSVWRLTKMGVSSTMIMAAMYFIPYRFAYYPRTTWFIRVERAWPLLRSSILGLNRGLNWIKYWRWNAAIGMPILSPTSRYNMLQAMPLLRFPFTTK